MVRLIGLIITLIGLAIAGWGVAGALSELVGLYSGALSAPLESPTAANGEVGEEAVAKSMIDSVIVGAAGVPFLAVGGVLMFIGGGRKRRARTRRNLR